MKKSLYLLLLLLFPIGLQAQSEVIVLHPDESKAEVNEAEYTRIFLAGTIDMGKSIDWQKATCDWFRARPKVNTSYTIPEGTRDSAAKCPTLNIK